MNIKRKNHLKFKQKEKQDNYGEILNVINKNNKNVTREKPTKTQAMVVESGMEETTINHLRQRKKLCEQKMVENNLKLLLSGKFDFDPKEILDKSFLFDLEKTSEDKIFDSILEKIPDKTDIYYIEHREGTNSFRLRKDPKKADKDELTTMLETVDRAIKRPTSKSKLSQLKQIKKQLVKKYEDLGEELIEYEWVKKNYLEGYRQTLKVFCLQKKI